VKDDRALVLGRWADTALRIVAPYSFGDYALL
jgi:hypothetical protein